MLQQLDILDEYIVPISILLIAVIFGLIIELLILARFRGRLIKGKFKIFQLIFKSLKGLPLIWFSLLGIYLAMTQINIFQSDFNLIKDTVFIFFAITIVLLFSRILVMFVTTYVGTGEAGLATTSILRNVIYFGFFLISFLITVQTFGIDITPLIALLGVGGITIGLGLQPTLSNFFAGLYLLATREFKVGDYIKLESDEEGYITDMNWRHLIVQPPSRIDIIIPNSRFSSAVVTNFSVYEKESVVNMQIGVGYESDMRKVEKLTVEIAKETVKQIQGNYPFHNPYLRFHTFAPSSIDFNLVIYVKNLKDRLLIKHEFMKNLHEKFKQENIDIPFPTMVNYIKNS